MTILTVDKWMVKPEKQAEHKKLMQKFHKFMKDNAAMFKGMRLLGEYTQMFGGISGMYVWLTEYDSLADLEKLNKRMEKNEKAKKLMQEWMPLIDPLQYQPMYGPLSNNARATIQPSICL